MVDHYIYTSLTLVRSSLRFATMCDPVYQHVSFLGVIRYSSLLPPPLPFPYALLAGYLTCRVGWR